MFGLGLISVCFLVIIASFWAKWGMIVSNKYENLLQSIKEFGCAVMFILISFLMALIYLVLGISTSNVAANSLLCSAFLVVSWMMTEQMYQLLTGKERSVLAKEDKNICNSFALLGTVIFSGVMWNKSGNMEYSVLICASISVWIGEYIPISEIYKGSSWKVIWCSVLQELYSKKKTVWIAASVSAFCLLVILYNDSFVQKISVLLPKFALGVLVGVIVMVICIKIRAHIRTKRK